MRQEIATAGANRSLRRRRIVQTRLQRAEPLEHGTEVHRPHSALELIQAGLHREQRVLDRGEALFRRPEIGRRGQADIADARLDLIQARMH